MKPFVHGIFLGGALTLLTAPAGAAPPWQPGVEFSAEVVRTYTNAPERSTQGRMYVSSHGIRTEANLNGKRVVMIFRPASKEAWMLLPDQKQFMRQGGMEMRRPPLPDEADSPCRTNKAYACRAVETVPVQGRPTQRWEVAVKVSEKESSRATLWIDPRLQLAVMEEYSDGLKVEMRGIREEPQSPELFKIPEGYQEVVRATEPPPESGPAHAVAPPTGRPAAPTAPAAPPR